MVYFGNDWLVMHLFLTMQQALNFHIHCFYTYSMRLAKGFLLTMNNLKEIDAIIKAFLMEPSTSSSINALLQGSSKQDGQAPPIPICFKMPTTDKELTTAKQNAKSLNTVKSNNWAVNT